MCENSIGMALKCGDPNPIYPWCMITQLYWTLWDPFYGLEGLGGPIQPFPLCACLLAETHLLWVTLGPLIVLIWWGPLVRANPLINPKALNLSHLPPSLSLSLSLPFSPFLFLFPSFPKEQPLFHTMALPLSFYLTFSSLSPLRVSLVNGLWGGISSEGIS